MIIGIAEAAQDISYPAMADRMEAVLDPVLKDPAVASVGASIGPGGLDRHAEPGARVHCAEAA